MKNAFLAILLLSSLSLSAYADDRSENAENVRIIQNSIFQLDKALNKKDFEVSIEKKYHATYLFLNKLSETQKKKVYEYYKTEPDFGKIRHKIFDLLFGVAAK